MANFFNAAVNIRKLKKRLLMVRSGLIFLLAPVFLFINGICFGFDDSDFQYWNTEKAMWKINNKWKAALEEEFRYGDNAMDFYYQHSDLGLNYSGLADWLDIGLNYRGIFEEANNDWSYENRPHINATFKTTWNEVSFSNRARMEFRIRKGSEDKLRYRNKAAIKFPFKWSRFNVQPYTSCEMFLDFDSSEFTRNRVYVGLIGKVTDIFKFDIFYLLQTSKSSGGWKETNVFGTQLKFDL